MANLELIPKLPVLAVQAGIFIANLGIMKKLFMDPYLKVKEAQEGMTIGSQGDAIRLLSQADSITASINDRMNMAMVDAKNSRELVRSAALEKRTQILDAVQKEVSNELIKVQEDIEHQVQLERSQISNVVANLANEVYKIALS
jgi:F0F1-type ATP synthase membrane subunit b/b'